MLNESPRAEAPAAPGSRCRSRSPAPPDPAAHLPGRLGFGGPALRPAVPEGGRKVAVAGSAPGSGRSSPGSLPSSRPSPSFPLCSRDNFRLLDHYRTLFWRRKGPIFGFCGTIFGLSWTDDKWWCIRPTAGRSRWGGRDRLEQDEEVRQEEGWAVFFPPEVLVPQAPGAFLSWRAHTLLFPFVRGAGNPGAQRLRVPPAERASWSERFATLDAELRQRRDSYRAAALSHLTLLLVELSRLAVDVVGDLKLKDEPLIAGVRKVPPSRYILSSSGLLIVHEFLLDVLPDLVPHPPEDREPLLL